MSVLTFKSDEFKTFPLILREYASYISTIKGNSEKTVCEYLLDLRTFFRFMIMRKNGDSLSREDLEKIDIKRITIEDVKEVTPQNIIDYLMFAGR